MRRRKVDFVLAAAWFFIIAAVLAGLCLIWSGISGKPTLEKVQSTILFQMKDSLGDILSGTLGICLSFSATLFMIVTFREQRKQHVEQLRQANRERFENTFFNMLAMFQDVRANVEKHLETKQNVKSLEDYYSGFIRFYQGRKKSPEVAMIDNLLSDKDLSRVDLEKAEEGLGRIYYEYSSDHNGSIGYYFRYVHHMINFVIDHWGRTKAEEADVRRYLNLIQAQMSDDELGLIFYDAISCHGLSRNYDKVFKNNLDIYGFLENISQDALLNRNNHKIYQSTVFRFLNAEERSAKISRRP